MLVLYTFAWTRIHGSGPPSLHGHKGENAVPKVTTESLLQKVMISVLSTAVLSVAGTSLASYIELKMLRSDLSSTIKTVEESNSKIKELDARVGALERSMVK
jgi:cell division protein FtsL